MSSWYKLKISNNIKLLAALSLIVSLITLTTAIQQDADLINKVQTLMESSKAKADYYSKLEIPKFETYSNITIANVSQFDNKTNIALFLNITGIISLEKVISNQRTSGIKNSSLSKYIDNIAKRFEFTDEIKDYFLPLFKKVLDSADNKWNNLELMFRKNSTKLCSYICILVKNNFLDGKVDFIITHVQMDYDFSNFVYFNIYSFNAKGQESVNTQIIKTDLTNPNIKGYEIEATSHILAAEGYNSLAEFLGIKSKSHSLLFLSE